MAVCPGPILTQMNEQVMADRAASLQLTRDQMIERMHVEAAQRVLARAGDQAIGRRAG